MAWRLLFAAALGGGAPRGASLQLREHSVTTGTPWPLFPGGPPDADAMRMKAAGGAETYTDGLSEPLCAIGRKPTMVFRNVREPALVPFLVKPGDPTYREDHATAAVVVIPGGCLQELEWVREGTDIAEWLNGFGISAFVLKHRVPGYDFMDAASARTDAQRAMRMLRHSAPRLGLNRSRIGLVGFSSGAKLVMSLSFGAGRGAYPPADAADREAFAPDFALMIYPGYFFRQVPRSVAPGRMPPPIFLVGAVDDPILDTGPALDLDLFTNLVPKKTEIVSDLLTDRVPTLELHLFPRGGHGFGRCTLFQEGEEWQPACMWPKLAQVFIEKEILHVAPEVQRKMERYQAALGRTFDQGDPYSLPHSQTNVSGQV